MMKKNLITVLFITLAVFASTSKGWSQTAAEPVEKKKLIAAGSGVNLGITRLLADDFCRLHPQIVIEVPGSIGTVGAIQAVADGAITFGLISRLLTEEEYGPGLTVKPYAQVALVFGTHPSVTDENITSQDVIEIFKGTKTRWINGQEIIVQARTKGDSGFRVLQACIPGFREVYTESRNANRWTIFFTDQDANRALATTPYALGVTDLGMITTEKLPIKILQFNGIEPKEENMRNGKYPLTRQLFFLYRADNLPEEAEAFLGFVFSDAGRRILQENRYITIN
jgi:phosphate transport system substrate-binding protein